MMRERRANAGSRMKQLIEEQRASAALKDEEEDDADFQEADEEDIVDSDFESTDEDEAANEAGMMVDEDPGDAETRRQAKRAKLIAAQTGKSRGFQPPTTKVRQHALSQSLDPVGPSTVVVTTGQGPGAIGSTTKKRTKERIEKKIELEKEKEKEREKGLSISLSPARRSYRASTMYSKILLEQKMEKNKQRQQVTLKRKSPHEVQLTQRELLAEAVDITEPFNLSYLEQMRIRDEEKRRQSKAIKPRLPPGPTITYISMRSDRYQQIITEISQEMAATENATNLEDRGPVDRPIEKIAAKGLESDSVRVLPQSTSKGSLVERSSILGENGGQTFGNSAASPADAPLDSMDSSCKNLIIFENYDEDPFMIFAKDSHSAEHDGTTLKCVPPQRLLCPITGLPAKYRDPSTGVPYANKEAHTILRLTLAHRFAWSPLLSAFVHPFDSVAPRKVPNGWLDASLGRGVKLPPTGASSDPSGLKGQSQGHQSAGFIDNRQMGVNPGLYAPNGGIQNQQVAWIPRPPPPGGAVTSGSVPGGVFLPFPVPVGAPMSLNIVPPQPPRPPLATLPGPLQGKK